jgi:hypothetical protein
MLDAVSLLREQGIQFWTKGKNVRPRWTHICCPMCEDHSNHGGISPRGAYVCWKCGRHPLASVLAQITNLDLAAIKGLIKQFSTIELGEATQTKIQGQTLAYADLPGFELGAAHKQYLLQRGYNPQVLEKKYRVRGTDYPYTWKGMDLSHRIIIPIFGFEGEVLTFVARDITGRSEIRYKACDAKLCGHTTKDVLYGMNTAQRFKRIMVVEGAFDALRFDDPRVMATLGTSLTENQLYLLSLWEEVVFLFDPEPEAQRQADIACKTLNCMGCKAASASIGTMAEDPGALSSAQAASIISDVF